MFLLSFGLFLTYFLASVSEGEKRHFHHLGLLGDLVMATTAQTDAGKNLFADTARYNKIRHDTMIYYSGSTRYYAIP